VISAALGAVLGGGGVALAAGFGLPLKIVGAPSLVADVERALGAGGIGWATKPQEDAVVVRLFPDAGGIRVSLRDPDGRSTERVVATAEIAAALIESWAHPDLTSPLLAAREPEPPPAVPGPLASEPAAKVLPADGSVVRTAPALPLITRVRPSGYAAFETGWASDRSLWMGARAGMCLRLGPACVGLAGRFAARTDAGLSDRPFNKEKRSSEIRRTMYDGLLTAELPVAIGRPTLRLGAGAGLGILATQGPLDDHESRGDDDRQGSLSRLGVRVEARAVLAIPLGAALSIDIGVAATAMPTARRSTFKGEDLKLPGEPIGQLSAAVALAWGVP
jgi:hypothetical protein